MGVSTGVDYGIFNFQFFEEALVHQDDIVWFNRKGVKKIDENRRAEIELVTNGVVGDYSGYLVSIVHKENGLITSHLFLFNDYFSQERRTDSRLDWKGSPSIVDHICKREGAARWYINVPNPDDIKQLAKKIMQFIEIYQ